MTMKKIIHALLCAGTFVMVLVSCSQDDGLETAQYVKVPMEFRAGVGDVTRTVLTDDNAVEWQAGDAISLFDPTGSNNEFTTSESGALVTFTGSAVDTEGTYYALYPYNAGASLTASNVLTTILPDVQTAVAGSFAGMLNPSVAVADGERLDFKNVCALVKFTLGGSGVVGVRFSGNNGEALAGTLQIVADAQSPSAVVVSEGALTAVALTGSFTQGETYYFVVAPAALNDGLTLTFYNAQGYEWQQTGTRAATLTAGEILNLGTVTPGNFQPADGYALVDGTYHIYTADGLQNWAAMNDLTSDVLLENNLDMTGKVWTPVGALTNGYTGDFDGNGMTISNLTVESNEQYAGFLGALSAGGTVSNLTFESASVTSTSLQSSVGVIVGHNLGVIDSCKVVDATVSGWYAGAVAGNNSVQINSCNVQGVTVITNLSGGQVGGIAGVNYGKIEYTTVSGASQVSANVLSGRAGGIVGLNTEGSGVSTSGVLLQCAVNDVSISAPWAGGIAGESSFGTIAQCVVNQTTVTHASSASDGRLGGIVGYNGRGDVVACYSSYSTVGGSGLTSEALGGIVGYSYNTMADIYGCYSTNVSLSGSVSGDESGMGCIAGYTNGNVTSCYGVLPSGVSGISLVGTLGAIPLANCVEVGATDYDVLVTGVPNLTTTNGTVWQASEIWNITASGSPNINATYMGN